MKLSSGVARIFEADVWGRMGVGVEDIETGLQHESAAFVIIFRERQSRD